MRKSISRCFGRPIKPWRRRRKKKCNICGRNSSALRQVYSLVLAGWIPEINFPDQGSENNSLSFVKGDETRPRYSSVGITSDPRIIWRWVLEIPVQPDSLSETPSLSLSLLLTLFLPLFLPVSHFFLFPHLSGWLRGCRKDVGLCFTDLKWQCTSLLTTDMLKCDISLWCNFTWVQFFNFNAVLLIWFRCCLVTTN